MTKEIIIVTLIVLVVYLYWRQKDTSFGITEELYYHKIMNLKEKIEIMKTGFIELGRENLILKEEVSLHRKNLNDLQEQYPSLFKTSEDEEKSDSSESNFGEETKNKKL